MDGRRAPCSAVRARRLTGMVIGLTAAFCAVATPAQADLTDIALTPTTGDAGTVVTISGANCRKSGQDLSSVHVVGPSLGFDVTIAPEPNGSWSGTFNVPPGAPEGPHDISATCIRNAASVAYVLVTFTVTAPTTVTTSSTGTTVPPPTTVLAPGTTLATVAPSTSRATSVASATTGAPTTQSQGAPTTLDQSGLPVVDTTSTGAPGQPTTTATGGEQDTVPSTSTGRADEGSADAALSGQQLSSGSDGAGPKWYLLAPLVIGVPISGWLVMRLVRARRRASSAVALLRPSSTEASLPDTEVLLLSASARHETDEPQMVERAPIEVISVDIGRGVRALEPFIRASVRPDVAVKLDVDPCPCCALVGAGDLDRLILPLVDNAAFALAAGGTIRIATGRGPCAAWGTADDDPDWALVVVADTGSGIPADVVATLFEARRTGPDGTSRPSSLAAVHRIVSDLGGHVDVSSVVGHGTTVTIALPLYDAPSEPIVMPDVQVLAPSSTA